MPIPQWLMLMLIGGLILMIARYIPIPSPFNGIVTIIGWVCLGLGLLLLIIVLLAMAGVVLPG